MPGAVNVVPDQSKGKGYLEIRPDRDRAARYGVNVGDIWDVVEVALGGKAITTMVDGRQRFPIRARYGRAFRQDEEDVKNLLINAGSAMTGEAASGGWARESRSRLRHRARGSTADPALHGRRRADRGGARDDQERKRPLAVLRAIERPRSRRRGLRRGGPAGRGAEGQASARRVRWPGAASSRTRSVRSERRWWSCRPWSW